MRRVPLALLVVAVAGCASTAPRITSTAAAGPTVIAASPSCTAPTGRDAPEGWCTLPADVRAFVDDRDACDHFRGEPWPNGDTAADRERRRQILEGLRTACAGTDAQLAALRARYAADARVVAVLAGYEDRVE